MKHWLFAAAVAMGAAAQAAPPEWVAARVVTVDAGRARVTLDHERIHSIGMDAMVMPFKVDKKVNLRPFKPGDRVLFRVSTKDDHLVVDALEKVK